MFVNTCVQYVVVSVVIVEYHYIVFVVFVVFVEYHSRVFVGFVGCPM